VGEQGVDDDGVGNHVGVTEANFEVGFFDGDDGVAGDFGAGAGGGGYGDHGGGGLGEGLGVADDFEEGGEGLGVG